MMFVRQEAADPPNSRGRMSNQAEARAVAEAMLALWEREFPATVRVLAAASDARRDYRPDPKSRSTWELLTHIATAAQGAFNFDPEKVKQAEAAFGEVADIVSFYEAQVPARLARLRALPDDQLAQPLDFFGMMNMSRAEWIGFANNHSVHHRGQLSTHLRAIGSKVPDIYGPSADAETEPPAA